MAIENPHFKADVVEASKFPQLAQKYKVVSVPKVVINDKAEFLGSLPVEEYLRQVVAALGPQPTGPTTD